MTTALALRPSVDVWEAADWKKLWRSLCKKRNDWRTIAVVPAGSSITPELSHQFAIALAYAGSLHLSMDIHVANATRLDASKVQVFSDACQHYLHNHDRLVLALAAFDQNPTSLPLARFADVAMLCVLLGEVDGGVARDTIAQLGSERFVGSAAFRLSPKAVQRITGMTPT